MNTETIRTLIVDDHAVVRSGYRSYLQQVQGFQVVAEADSADEAYAQYKRLHPDVVIMDIMLQGASGIDASRRILSNHPGAKILIFSMYASPVLLQQALDVGVLGAVGKQCDPDTLREAAIAVARGDRYLDASMAQSLVFSKYDRGQKAFDSLSQREFEIFLLLISGAPGDEIAEALSLSVKTIANRASIIRQKLGVSSDIQLVKLAAAAGVVPWIRPDLAAN
ncbi:MAG TPA: response regulator transcription factor [Ideonella sp.]|nr:response regulator transcription factor [Ideonella sp.]